MHVYVYIDGPSKVSSIHRCLPLIYIYIHVNSKSGTMLIPSKLISAIQIRSPTLTLHPIKPKLGPFSREAFSLGPGGSFQELFEGTQLQELRYSQCYSLILLFILLLLSLFVLGLLLFSFQLGRISAKAPEKFSRGWRLAKNSAEISGARLVQIGVVGFRVSGFRPFRA